MVQVYRADEGGLPSADRGLAYGDGLFETIRAEGAHAPLLSGHLDRLTKDARRLGIPASRGELEKIAIGALGEFSGHYSQHDCEAPWVLKLTLTRGAGGRGYQPAPGMQPNLLVAHSPAPPAPDPRGVCVEFSPVPLTVNPLLCGIKSLNRLEQVMAARALQGPVFEVLMSNSEGHVVEGTRTNIFVLTDAGWLTPPGAALAVSGVMRSHVLSCLYASGEPVHEAPITLEWLMSDRCRGLYLTNSVLGIVPVRNLADQDLPVDNRLATICGSPTKMDKS